MVADLVLVVEHLVRVRPTSWFEIGHEVIFPPYAHGVRVIYFARMVDGGLIVLEVFGAHFADQAFSVMQVDRVPSHWAI